MELDQIKKICKESNCKGECIFNEGPYKCYLEDSPNNWDLEEIERRLKNYGKEKEN